MVLAEAINKVGTQHFRRGEYVESAGKFEDAHGIMKRQVGDRDLRTVSYLANYSASLAQHGIDMPSVIETEREILALRREVHGNDSEHVATCLNNLATFLVLTGDFEGAVGSFEEARDIYRKVLGPRHALMANTARNLCLTYVGMERFETAGAWADSARAASGSVFPPGSPEAVFYELVGPWVWIQQGRSRQAVPELRRLVLFLAQRERHPGAERRQDWPMPAIDLEAGRGRVYRPPPSGSGSTCPAHPSHR